MTLSTKTPNEPIYDTQNALLALSIYHRDFFVKNGKPSNVVKLYLKKTNDLAYQNASEDQQFFMEIENAKKAVENKLYGRNAGNPITSISLYSNHNKGGTLRTSNVRYCMLQVKPGGRFERNVDTTIAQNAESLKIIEDLFEHWEFHFKRAAKP